MAHNVALETLTERIAQQLQERGFCVVFEHDLERCWPSDGMPQAEREKNPGLRRISGLDCRNSVWVRYESNISKG